VPSEICQGALFCGDGWASRRGGFLDLDTDQNPSTGVLGFTDTFGPPGTNTGLGMDFFVDLFSVSGGMANVFDASGNPTGSAPVEFKGTRMTVSIPLETLGGDDGKVDFATVLGTLCEPTDIAPNEGHLTSK
jgi:serralysin